MSDPVVECTRHNLPMGRPSPASAGVYVVSCAHVGDKFITAIEGTSYRFIDFVRDEDGDVAAVEVLAALEVPVDEEDASAEWEQARRILSSGRQPV